MSCAICGSVINIDRHHIKPKALGGENTEENLIDICKACHSLLHKFEIYNKKDIQVIKENGFSWWLYCEYVGAENLSNSHIKSFGSYEINFGNFIISLLAESVKGSRIIREGLNNAKEKGVILGRPEREVSNEFKANYKKWKANEITAIKFAKIMNMSRATLYRYIKEYEKVV